VTDRETLVARLKARASIAMTLGEEEAARVLRGYASTIAADLKAMARIRSALVERIVPFSPALIDVVWADALADVVGQSADLAVAAADRARAIAEAEAVRLRSTSPSSEELAAAERRAAVVEADAAKRVQAAEKRVARAEAEGERRLLAAGRNLLKVQAEAAEREEVLAKTLADLHTRAATAEEELFTLRQDFERRTKAAAVIAVSRLPLNTTASARTCAERLAAIALPDARTWLRLTEEIAAAEGVPMPGVLSRHRTPSIVHVRFHVWWWLRVEALRLFGVTYSYPEIGRAWCRDHTTIMSGVAIYEIEIAKTPPSGERLSSGAEPGIGAAA
jgi:hypothetical protein